MKIGFGPLLGIALAAGVLVGIAFGGGALYGRKHAPAPAQASAAPGVVGAAGAGAAARAGGAAGAAAGGTPVAGQRGGGAAGAGAGGAGGAVQGAIISIDGSTMTVRTAAGVDEKVTISAQTQVSSVQPASQSDLAPGSVVLVQGQPSDGGAITAGAITITTASRVSGPQPAGTPGTAPRRAASASATAAR
jgi:hypothetical protein